MRWTCLVLLTWCSVLARAAACPARCQCDLAHEPRTIKCSGQGLTVFPENVSDIVEYLDLSNNELTELPDSIVLLDSLQQLNLGGNQLSYLPKNLRGLFNLRRVDLSFNNFRDPSDLASLGHLPRLKYLQLSNNHFEDLVGLRSTSLQHLNADSCGIKSLGNRSLLGLPELTHLSLVGNELLDNIRFPVSLKLRGLDLSRCYLSRFTTSMVQGFPELLDLRLAENPELNLNFTHEKLQKLDVSRCSLLRPRLNGLPSLTVARFTSNRIKELPNRVFAPNSGLNQLYLDNNLLDSLNQSAFVNLQKLQVLDLSENLLMTVPSMVFKDNKALQFLNLSNNDIKEIPKLVSSVVSLDLSDNLISRIERDSLEDTPKILHLNLAKNFISYFPKDLTSPSLRSLALKSNKISSLHNVSMAGLPGLEKLDLSDNFLSEGLDPEIFSENENLRQLHLQNNPWHCDCDQLHACYLFLSRLETKSDPLLCASPSNVNGHPWKSVCINIWQTKLYQARFHSRAWGLVLVVLLIMIVMSGMIVSIRHSMKLKRQARNHRLEMERAEVRERLRLLQRRNMQMQDEHGSEPRIHPLELISPPSYEEAVTMPRLARSLDGLDSVTGDNLARMTGSSESLRTKKMRRARRTRNRLRSLSEDNLARRELRREERLRRVRGEPEGGNEVVVVVEEAETQKSENIITSKSTPKSERRRSRRMSAKAGTSTDDEDSDAGKPEKGERRIGKTVIRNLGKEPKCGYRPSTDGES